jgi:hypothetical protein
VTSNRRRGEAKRTVFSRFREAVRDADGVMLTRRRGGAEGIGKFKERRLNESAIGEDDK